MNKTEQKLMRARLGRWRPLSSFGYVVFESRAQLKTLLMGCGQQAVAAHFAEGEPDRKFKQVQFVTELAGPVRRLNQLSTAERRHALARLREIQHALNEATQQLKAQALGRPSATLQWLEYACRLPADVDVAQECVYFVGGEPVLCYWGFEDTEHGAVDLRQWEAWPELAPDAPQAAEPGAAETGLSAMDMSDGSSTAGDSGLPDAAPSTQWPTHAPSELPEATPFDAGHAPAPTSAAHNRGSPRADARPGFVARLAGLRNYVRWRLRELSTLQRRLGVGALIGVLLVLPLVVVATLSFNRWAPVRFDSAGVPLTKGRTAGDEMQIPATALAKADVSFATGVWQIGEARQALPRVGGSAPAGSMRRVVQFNAKGGGRFFGVERIYDGKEAPACVAELTLRAAGQWLYIDHVRCVEQGGGIRHLPATRYECQRRTDGRARCVVFEADGTAKEVALRRLG